MILELLQNAALILLLCLSYWYVVQRWPQGRWAPQIVVGLLFGLAAVISMAVPVDFAPGIIFDARTVVLSLGALFAGPVVAIAAAAIAATYRVWLGGVGMVIGISTILLSVGVGLAFRQYHRDQNAPLSVWQLLIFGLTVHIPVIGLFAFLPVDFFDQVLLGLGPPYLAFFSAASVAAGLGFREIEKSHRFADILGESERHFRSLFNVAEIALFEVDLTRLWRDLHKLREAGVSDLPRHLSKHPGLLEALVNSIYFLRVNYAGQNLLQITSEDEINKGLSRFFGVGGRQFYIGILDGIWHGRSRIRSSLVVIPSDGQQVNAIISLPLPDSEKSARCVPLSMLDVTELQGAQSDAIGTSRRLKEILWGTNAGTWEWQVKTGKGSFNHRWAAIVGYRLQELEPVTMETWARLVHPDDSAISEQELEKAYRREVDYYDCTVRMRHKSGHYVWVHVRGRVAEWNENGEPMRVSGILLDVSKHKNAEKESERLLSLCKTFLQCQSILLQEQQEQPLFQRLSKCLVSNPSYRAALVGVPQPGREESLILVATAGELPKNIVGMEVQWSEEKLNQGISGTARETGEVELSYAPESTHTRSSVTDSQKKASLALPVLVGREVAAVLTIYCESANTFSPDELELVHELGLNLSARLQVLRSAPEKQLVD